MKKIHQTLAGKVTIFILCILSAAICGAGIFGALYMDSCDFYSGLAPEELYDVLKERMIMNDWLFYTGIKLRYTIFLIIVIAGLVSLICFIALMCASARHKDEEGVHPGFLNVIPSDVVFVCYVLAVVLIVGLLDWLGGLGSTDMYDFVLLLVCGVVLAAITVGICMDAAARIKERSLIKNSLLYKFLLLLKRFCLWVLGLIVKLPLIWKSVVCLLAIMIVDAILIAATRHDAEEFLVWFFLSRAAFGTGAVYLLLKLKLLQKGGEELAKGNLNYVIDTKGMPSDFKNHAQNLTGISSILQAAVEQRMKSERMKTELITNVSHDIKTPLTSIINYADLMTSEHCDNPKHAEYLEVLTRQSGKLKKLIEDLVEASKASSGVLEVNPEPCDASLFVTQAVGEYEEKLKAADLTLIEKLPDEPITIMADGRRMWRIFDNLMGNICKYSQPGTRVYLELAKDGEMAQFTFKNTSRDILNITEEELMERFVRGDVSRNTEGNGLGLSIAKSMAELQGGWLRLDIDGDLFKAILRFPCVKSE